MKAMAMSNRLKEKDAWDIHFSVRNYPGGLDALAEEIRPFLGHGLVLEALNHLSSKFSSPSAVGPTHVVDFDDITDPEDRALGQRDAFERIQYLLNALVKDG
jgi:hypothetical protein